VPTPSDLAVISGGSSGIGAAIGRMFCEENKAVALLARREENLRAVSTYLQAEGGDAHPLVVDVSLSTDVEKVSAFVKKFKGSLKYLVHNAGLARVGSVEHFSVADWKRTLDVNLTAPFVLTRHLLPLMSPDSHIIFINSVAGKQTFPEWSAYCASKHGLRAFADTLRKEVAARGIKVTTLFPGAVDTPLHDSLPYDWEREKMLQPTHVAEAVRYIIRQPSQVTVPELDLSHNAGLF